MADVKPGNFGVVLTPVDSTLVVGQEVGGANRAGRFSIADLRLAGTAILDTASKVMMTVAERTKLAGLATQNLVWGQITGTLGNQTDLTAALAEKAAASALGALAAKSTIATADITDGAVTPAKMQARSASRLLGRGSAAGNGSPEEITLGANLAMSGTTLNATGSGSGVTDGDKGHIVVSGGGLVWLIEDAAVTPAKLENRAASTLFGRGAGTAGVPQEITLGSGLSFTGTVLSASAGASAAYVSQRTVTASGNITIADRYGVVLVNGSSVTMTLVHASFNVLDWVEVVNTGADDGTAARVITIAANGTDGLNGVSGGTVALRPGDSARFVKVATSTPIWRSAGSLSLPALPANNHMVRNTANTGYMARRDASTQLFRRDLASNGTFVFGLWPHRATTLARVSLKAFGTATFSCTAVVTKNGTAINGFASPVALAATRIETNSTEAISQFDEIGITIAAQANISSIIMVMDGVRTAD